MTRDIILVNLPDIEPSQSIAYKEVIAFEVDATKGITIEKAAENKNNSLSILIENAGDVVSSATFVAGDSYPNAMLGDLEIPLKESTTTVCQLQDLSRFENRDGSIHIDFKSDFVGKICAIAKRAGILPVV